MTSTSTRRLITPHEVTSYDEILEIQESAHIAVLDGGVETLWMGEHRPVVTLGRRTDPANLLVDRNILEAGGTVVRETDRGGDVTWHGPGQLVGYPIINLNQYKPDLHWYLRQLECLIVDTLAEFDVRAHATQGKTGVWVNVDGVDCKIASIGVHCSRWITKHGFSLNVCPNLDSFSAINACGLNCRQTSLKEILGADAPTLDEVREIALEQFDRLFIPAVER